MTRDELHQLVDGLDETEFQAAAFVLKNFVAAPDDEPLTDEDRQALAEARDDRATGRTTLWRRPAPQR
jgi:hypothetical protein